VNKLAEICGILADLDICVGCYACEIACKQENNVPIGIQWIKVVAVGPEKLGDRLRMNSIPMMTDGCTLCQLRLDENLEPRCVDNCPTQALKFCKDAAELLLALQSGRHFQVCKVKGDVPAFG